MSAPYYEADLHDTPTAWLRCECGYTGCMVIRQSRAGTPAGSPSPPEDATFEAKCPRCRLLHDWYEDGS